MKLPNPYQCDREGCTVTKAKSNGWWLVLKDSASFIVAPWKEEDADGGMVRHVCSESCLQTMLGNWMAEIHRRPVSIEPPISARKEAAI